MLIALGILLIDLVCIGVYVRVKGNEFKRYYGI